MGFSPKRYHVQKRYGTNVDPNVRQEIPDVEHKLQPIQHSGTITIRPQQEIPECRDTRRLGMERIRTRRPIRTPHHTKQQIPANKQKPQKTTIIPMKLNPANKQTTFEKRLPINVIHLENYRYQNLTKKEKKLSEYG